MESVLIAGLAAAFVLSVLDYWVQNPLVRAVAGSVTALISVLIVTGWNVIAIPETLAAAFLGAFAMSLTNRDTPTELRRGGTRL